MTFGFQLVASVVFAAFVVSAASADGALTSTTVLEPDAAQQCGDANADGQVLATDALLALRTAVGDTTQPVCSPLVCDVIGGADGLTSADALLMLRVAVAADDRDELGCPSVARYWNEVALAAFRLDAPRPPVHARTLFHLSVVFWDVWVVYDHETLAARYLTEEPGHFADGANAARVTAMSYAARRLLEQRFSNSSNADEILIVVGQAFDALGLGSDANSESGDSPAAVGTRIAEEVRLFGLLDGSNEANDYADDTGYGPVNLPLIPAFSGTTMADPNRWQPLSLEFFVTQNGIPLPLSVQPFENANWGNVTPFALTREFQGAPYFEPGLPPQLGGLGDQQAREAALDVVHFSSQLDPGDEVTVDIGPGALGNNSLGTNDGSGHSLNPASGEPYRANVVLRGDYARVIAEYWSQGASTETPPGLWNSIANAVADSPVLDKRIEGTSALVDDLEWDVKIYLALNGALHDAAVAAWEAKARYDSPRPLSLIRHMGGLGQSSNPEGESYSPTGLPLADGLIEIITDASTAPGQRHEHLRNFEGEVGIYVWAGRPDNPADEFSGAAWQRAARWLPYQAESVVAPASPAYVSGLSTFGRAAAEVLTRMTGSAFFPGGVFDAPAALADDFLQFEAGPSHGVARQWATYRDVADEAGISGVYEGIHRPVDDLRGRMIGAQIGNGAFDAGRSLWGGSISQ
ncbi:MAG: hypothetical protein ACI8TX_000113 [Hyphomicrobiaceae bacterium]|jgi:hypothetical protein